MLPRAASTMSGDGNGVTLSNRLTRVGPRESTTGLRIPRARRFLLPVTRNTRALVPAVSSTTEASFCSSPTLNITLVGLNHVNEGKLCNGSMFRV